MTPSTHLTDSPTAPEFASNRRPAATESLTIDAHRRAQRVAELFRDHAAELRPYLWRQGICGEDVGDLMQRVFVTLTRRIDDVNPGCERAFLFRTASNEAWHLRRTYARCREDVGDATSAETTGSQRPDELLRRKYALQLVHECLQTLEPALRRVFELVELEELTLLEAATQLGIPLGTAKTRLRRARSHIDHATQRLRS